MSTSNHETAWQSARNLADQLMDGYEQTKAWDLPKKLSRLNKIVISGMGGSNLGGRFVQTVFGQELKAPLLINADYEVGRWIDSQTLFLAVSYSGATEETLFAAKAALLKKAKVIILTAGHDANALATWAKQTKTPAFFWTTEFNPSAQPRFGIGYNIAVLIALLSRLGYLNVKDGAWKRAVALVRAAGEKLLPEKSSNPASRLAHDLSDHFPLIISGEFLSGAAHIWRNFFNETAKTFAAYLTVPEMNHYALEGLVYPKEIKSLLKPLILASGLYSPKTQTRLELTRQACKKQDLAPTVILSEGQIKLEQALSAVQLGLWTGLYLSQINKINPLEIKMVDWFKGKMR